MASASSLDLVRSNPLTAGVADLYASFQERRAKLGLPNPGTTENLAKEVQRDVFLNNHSFSGLRADLTKVFSLNPLFQVSHQFAVGERINPYTFAAMYGSSKVFMQGSVDNEMAVSTRFNWRWSSAFVTKSSFQLGGGGGQDMVQIENDYTGGDFSASVKALNPSFLEGGISGIYVGSYMQSLTKRLSLGLEGVWQRASLSTPPETVMSYVAKYKTDDWVATGQLSGQGQINTTFWRKISDKVQAGIDMTLSVAPADPEAAMFGAPTALTTQGVTTAGVKYDFRMSTLRAQVDTKGKMGCLVEKRVGGPVMMTVAAEIDHPTGNSKLGVSISLDLGGEELQEQQEAMGSGAQESPNIPF
ncbi:mitochondrial import receptor subunit tom-40 [Gaeumannomyces tritici R3-111a-1]|uniref:Mitochondrial import receptor subunit tom-40 n=1 Tax=Gaeumannomyces tritici (strain R3-111a-1) TaxID=644352 RepID=J3P119_GAET3|nr:mitochondrial import receptor subunit tom-40 [Gaeumannomyces tritici R3-111a-1]EJT77304.1 mitochondrial import receptor subunit tom-40 [Gaeumannomyces tritici R3-111a-1]